MNAGGFMNGWPPLKDTLKEDRPLLARARQCLREVFGYSSFRPLQEECILSVLKKQDTLLLMPTGGGKSLCYQIPALIFPGLTVVVSPLIALMQDQVDQLKAWGVEAEVLNSSLSLEAYRMNQLLVRAGRVKVLFLAPETLMKEDVLNLLEEAVVDFLVIDEAHCISEWGHDFRPEYRQLAAVRERFPQAVCLAVTATATPRVREDIVRSLRFSKARQMVASFNRPNLFYEVLPKQRPLAQVIDVLKRFAGQSGIIYCFSRRQVDDLTRHLRQAGYHALPYHAGLGDAVRRRHQQRFIRDDVPIMVATIAFGMGINKPNVRFVIHYDIPRNIESYYQETGRAGRDGLPAHCLLLFGYGDIRKVRFFIDQKEDKQERRVALGHLDAMVAYAETRQCRRKPLLGYFGETFAQERCGVCDNCARPRQEEVDLTPPARKFLACVARTGQRFGAKHVIDVLRGSRCQKVLQYEHQDLDVYAIGRDVSARAWQFFLRQFLEKGLLRKEEEFGVLKLTPRAVAVLKNQEKVMGYAPPAERKEAGRPKGDVEERTYDETLLRRLKAKRKALADQQGVPPYVIFSDKSLIDMASRRPRDLMEFARVFGVGQKKLEVYGRVFLEVLAQ